MVAIVFHCLPCFSSPSKKTTCSSSVQRPIFSEALLAFAVGVEEEDEDLARWIALLGITTRGGTERNEAIAGGAATGFPGVAVSVMVKEEGSRESK